VIIVAVDSERLSCGGFSLDEIVCLGNFEFITDYNGGLSLSPKRGESDTPFMGSIHSGASSPQWAMIEDSAVEFLTVSSSETDFGLPSPRRHGMGAPPAPIATTPWQKDILDISVTQQAESSLQHRAEASLSRVLGIFHRTS
jgi:hypothetical protein